MIGDCKIDHAAPDALPTALCRTCHPELNPTTAQRATMVALERQRQDEATRRSNLLRQLGKAEQQLAQAERKVARGGGSQGIGIRQAKAARRKIERLKLELDETPITKEKLG